MLFGTPLEILLALVKLLSCGAKSMTDEKELESILLTLTEALSASDSDVSETNNDIINVTKMKMILFMIPSLPLKTLL
jgi:hypothetical protein